MPSTSLPLPISPPQFLYLESQGGWARVINKVFQGHMCSLQSLVMPVIGKRVRSCFQLTITFLSYLLPPYLPPYLYFFSILCPSTLVSLFYSSPFFPSFFPLPSSSVLLFFLCCFFKLPFFPPFISILCPSFPFSILSHLHFSSFILVSTLSLFSFPSPFILIFPFPLPFPRPLTLPPACPSPLV